ncbi:unnamed protein product [Sphagnum compactum]
MTFQVMMMKKTMSRKRGRLRGSLKTAKGKEGIKIQPKAVEKPLFHESPDFEEVQEKRTETHEAVVDDGGNNDTDIQEVTVESIKETEVPDVLLAEEKSLSPPCSPPRSRSRRVRCLLGQPKSELKQKPKTDTKQEQESQPVLVKAQNPAPVSPPQQSCNQKPQSRWHASKCIRRGQGFSQQYSYAVDIVQPLQGDHHLALDTVVKVTKV